MKSILDPSFVYVPAANTDIRKTFERVRLEIENAKKGDLEYTEVDELRAVQRIGKQ